ncbi:ABC transporter permease subunit [Vitreoscilla massiliensis]|uniref:ABC transporter permease subunit n=1 Tax=Vitreoscilla massiliensis TaxID=1689272 RepID=A0ABY4E407_9NEIS|nr:ABC transporter permease subunit [Vitreoscilla massiliensis]UOO90111.1 ABC transporter permease subunit [Vitreoscilla massiliensis]
MKQNNISSVLGRWFVIAVPYTWLLVLFLIPFLIVLKISFAEQDIAIPPYTPLVSTDSDMGRVIVQASYLNYADIVKDFWQSLGQILNPFHNGNGDNIYLQTYWSSLKTAVMVTVLCLIFGYPIAYAISRVREDIRNGVLLLIMLPFWTSFLLRVYAWMGILSTTGLVNTWLQNWGIIDGPLELFYNQFSLTLVMVYAYLPFMILPLYTQLLKLDHRLLEAAGDLGASPIKSFLTITLPLSKVGMIAGSMLVFIPCVGEYVIPELVGGPENLMIGKVLWQAFFDQNNWPLASAVAVIMVLLLVVPIAIFHRYENREIEGENA